MMKYATLYQGNKGRQAVECLHTMGFESLRKIIFKSDSGLTLLNKSREGLKKKAALPPPPKKKILHSAEIMNGDKRWLKIY